MGSINKAQRIEYVFNFKRFMNDVRLKAEVKSLRGIEVLTGVSASTLSRIDNGQTPDLQSFLMICGRCQLLPQNYFDKQIWELKDGS